MGFLVENEKERRCERKLGGRYGVAAVDCWFPATGNFYPRMAKYQERDGSIQCIRDIQVLYWEQKYYAGIQARKFQCKAEFGGQEREFTLLFYPENGNWNIVRPDGM